MPRLPRPSGFLTASPVLRLDGASATLTSFFYFIDPPLNCFPSKHLALGVWSGLMLIEDRPRLKWLVWPIIVWIGVSVLFVRQHYLLDAVAGTSLALLTRWWFRRRGGPWAVPWREDAPR